MKTTFVIAALLAIGSLGCYAQNSVPAPGSGSLLGGGGGPGPVMPPPSTWGGGGWNDPWNPCWNCSPFANTVISPTVIVTNPDVGTVSVVGGGYDDYGVWRKIPMAVHYVYKNGRYNVVVLTAWDPWTHSWNRDLNIPAVNTTYMYKGRTYKFYVVLSTGIYYFNL